MVAQELKKQLLLECQCSLMSVSERRGLRGLQRFEVDLSLPEVGIAHLGNRLPWEAACWETAGN